jgi:hypothetical protein
MKPTLALSAAFAALVLLAPAAHAMKYEPLSVPNPPQCPVYPAPEPGGGLKGEAESILHTQTEAACTTEGDAVDAARIGVGLVSDEATLVMQTLIGVVGPLVDGTQDNVCDAVYGNHDHTNDPGCQEIVVSANTSPPPPQ